MQLPDNSFTAKLDTLSAARGTGSGMVSISVPPSMDIVRLRAFVSQEETTAQNIKNPRNRKAVTSTLAAIHQFLKTAAVPTNGALIYAGDGDVTFLEPPTQVLRFTYNCGSAYDIDSARALLDTGGKYGYIVIDGHGALYAIVASTGHAKIVAQRDVDLPPKQGRGGQSQNRFARLRL